MAAANRSTVPSGTGESIFSDCPGRDILNRLTSRWAPLILLALVGGALRFHILRGRIEGISEKMLSQTLQMLARDGFVHREVRPTVPPQVSYRLTPLGAEAAAALQSLVNFLRDRTAQVLAARQVFDGELPV